jgi:membrane protease YdiL (CAAX protease family)
VNRFPVIHRALAISLVFAAPLAVYLANGTVEFWAFLLGAVMGFCYWYFWDPLP